MGLESFDKISDLDAANPPGGDNREQGDDHLRGIKLTLRNLDPSIKVGGPAQLKLPGTYGVTNDWSGKAGEVIAIKTAEDGWEHKHVDDLITKTSTLTVWAPGVPTVNSIIAAYVFDKAVTLPASLGTSRARALVVATDGSFSFDIRKNGSSIGSIDWAISTAVATFTFASQVAFAVGDYISLHSPNPVDTTLADLMITLQGTR